MECNDYMRLPMESIKLKEMHIHFRESSGKMFFKVSDLQLFPEWPEGPLLELLDGELYMVPSPSTYHQELIAEIIFQIKSFLMENSVGRIIPSPYDVYFSEENYVIPDIIFVSNKNEKIITSKNIQGVPDLIIEVVSSNRENDFVRKRDLYEKQGVPEYLIFDPRDKIVYQYLMNDEVYQSPVEYSFSDKVKVHTIDGLSLRLQLI